jgi:hypothetical protein
MVHSKSSPAEHNRPKLPPYFFKKKALISGDTLPRATRGKTRDRIVAKYLANAGELKPGANLLQVHALPLSTYALLASTTAYKHNQDNWQ